MSSATVTEVQRVLEPVTVDPFIADLDVRSAELASCGQALLQAAAVAPHRRIFD